MQCAWRALHDKNYNYKDNYQYTCIVKQIGLTQADGEVRPASTASVANGIASREIGHHCNPVKIHPDLQDLTFNTSVVHLVHSTWRRTSTGTHRWGSKQPNHFGWNKLSLKGAFQQRQSIINIHFSADTAGVRGARFVCVFAQGWRSSVWVLPSVRLQLTVVFLGADRPLQSCMSSKKEHCHCAQRKMLPMDGPARRPPFGFLHQWGIILY